MDITCIVPGDDRDRKAKMLINRWPITNLRYQAILDTFRPKNFGRNYGGYFAWHILAIVIVGLCRNVCLDYGTVPIVHISTWIVVVTVCKTLWPCLRFAYWLILYLHYDDKWKQATADGSVLLIKKQRF